MKILMIGSYLPKVGGAERALHELCLELSKDKNIKISILCPKIKGFLEEERFQTLRAWTLIKDNRKIERFNFLEYFQNYSFVIPAIIKGKKEIKQNKIDIIHSQFGISFGLIGVILKKITKIPLVTTLHGGGLNFSGWRKILRPLARYILNNSDVIISVSNSLKRKAEKEIFKKIVVIHNSVFPEQFERVGEEFVLSVGRIVKLKGFEFLIKAASNPFLKNVKFKIVGDGPEKMNLENLISQYKLNNIELLGSLNHEQTKEMMSKCSIFCLPSLSEGLPLVILEAMACGKPIVTTGVGGIKEAVKDSENGFIVKTKNSKEISDRIYKLIKNKKLRKKMGNLSKNKIVTEFNWKNNGIKIKEIYQGLMK
jgi:glycosyltransferase involved in cell wall biosynthesis